MISREQRERDKAICEAATAGPWGVSQTGNVWGPVYAGPPNHDQIADAEEMERRVEAVAAEYRQHHPGTEVAIALVGALRILRGES